MKDKVEKSFQEELAELLAKHNVHTQVGCGFMNYDMFLDAYKFREFMKVPQAFQSNVRKCAEFLLINAKLSEDRKEWLEKIVDGWLPEPFVYDASVEVTKMPEPEYLGGLN